MPTHWIDVNDLVKDFEYLENPEDAQEYTDEQITNLEGEMYE